MWVPTEDFAQLQLQFVDQTQWRYEVIRPLVLFADRTPQQRAQETDTHPDTVRTLPRRFRQQGMLGLLPADVEVVRPGAGQPRSLRPCARRSIGSRRSMTGSTTANWPASCSSRWASHR